MNSQTLTNNWNNLVITDEMLAQARRDRLALIANNRPRLEEEFGIELSDYDVTKILKAEKEISFCTDCKGLPCKKKIGFENLIPIIKKSPNKSIDISYRHCKYTIIKHKVSRMQRVWQSSQIPKLYQGKYFSDYTIDSNNSYAVAAAKKFVIAPNRGIYFFGNSGTGKTYLAAIIAQMILDRKSILFADVPSFLDELRDSIQNEHGDKLNAKVKTLQKADVLFLDDLGTEKVSEWALERLYIIINNLYNEGKPVVITSNYSLTELYNHYGKNIFAERITSRINQICDLIRLHGKDRRNRD